MFVPLDAKLIDALFANTSEAVALYREGEGAVFGAAGVDRLLGRGTGKLTSSAFAARVHPDDRDEFIEVIDQARTRPGRPQRLRFRARHVDGTYKFLRMTFTNHADDPEIGGWVMNLVDETTSRMNAESATTQRLHARFSNDAVVVLGPELDILFSSQSVERLLGFTAEELRAHPALDHLHPDDLDVAMEKLGELYDDPSMPAIARLRFVQKDGTYRWMSVTGHNETHDPDTGGIVLRYHDIQAQVDVEEQLRSSEERFRKLVESSPLGVFHLDAFGGLVWANDRWSEIAGIAASEILGLAYQDFIHELDRERLLREWVTRADERETICTRYRWVRPDGEVRWVETNTAPYAASNGDLVGHVGTVQDVTATIDAAQQLERFAWMVRSATDVVILLGPDGSVRWRNEAGSHTLGDAEHIEHVVRDDSVRVLREELIPTLLDAGAWTGELTLTPVDGVEIPLWVSAIGEFSDDTGSLENISLIGRDMTERREFQTELQRQALTDPLTKLPNRSHLIDFLEHELQSATDENPLAVFFCDLDGFKMVNDSLGHQAGDAVLIEIASRLPGVVRPGDLVARFGGDEFVIVCPGVGTPLAVAQIGQRIAAAVAEPIPSEHGVLRVLTSVGVAIAGADANADDLLRDADTAMYQAKSSEGGALEFFSSDNRIKIVERHQTEQALREAIRTRALDVHFQPQIDVVTGRIAQVEALCRWTDPKLGFVSPAAFIPIAEETGLIGELGAFVLEEACIRLAEWRALGHDVVGAVNVSAKQLSQPTFVQSVVAALAAVGLPPHVLELEVTESLVTDEAAVKALAELRACGVRIAIDDFGTGYSSLASLHRLPIDTLKVDREFVCGLGQASNTSSEAVVDAILRIARSLGVLTVAEGVETVENAAAIGRLGFDLSQGFLHSRPVSGDELTEMLDRMPVQKFTIDTSLR